MLDMFWLSRTYGRQKLHRLFTNDWKPISNVTPVSDGVIKAGWSASNRKLLCAARSVLGVLYWIAVLSLFTYAAFLRFRLPPEPILDPDTYGYLSPAVGKLIGTGFVHHLRNYLYPSFLFLVLKCFGDFRAITIVQHLLGLTAGAIFLLAWQRIRSFIPLPRLPQLLYGFIGLIAAAIYLTAEEPIRFETDIRPEGIVSFLIILNIFLILEFSYRCYLRSVRTIPVMLGVCAVVSSVITALAKPSLAIAVAGALAPLAAALFYPFSRRSKVALVIGSLAAATLLILPAQLPARHDPANRAFLPTQLFVIHADLIRDQIANDLSDGAATKYSTELLRRVHQILVIEINKTATFTTYPVLGFHPDYLMYNPTSLDAQMHAEFRGRTEELCAFYRYYYKRVWLKQPYRMAGKIARQMLVFYGPFCPAYYPGKIRHLSKEYSSSLAAIQAADLRHQWAGYQPLEKLIRRTSELAQEGLEVPVPRLLWRSQWFLGRTYLLAVAFSVVAVATVLLPRQLRYHLGSFAGVTAFVCWYNFAACLEVAIVHTLDNRRYNTIQLVFTLLAQFTAFLLIGRCAFEIGRSVWKTRRTSTDPPADSARLSG